MDKEKLPKGIVKTGIYATEEEVKEIRALYQEAKNTPVIWIPGSKIDEASRALTRFYKKCNEIAVSHGLPEIEGYYGVSPKNQFIRYKD